MYNRERDIQLVFKLTGEWNSKLFCVSYRGRPILLVVYIRIVYLEHLPIVI